MGCILTCLACEAASCACRGVCKCCGAAIPAKAIAGRVAYTAVFFLFSLIAWIFRVWAKQILGKVPVLRDFCSGANEQVCYGALAVYRVSFSLAIYHLILAVIMIGVYTRGDMRTHFQEGWWPVKLLFLFGTCIASFFIPNPFFEYYGWIALGAAALFILVQLVLLVDFAHSWAENWIEKMENDESEGSKRWFYILLTATGILYCLSLALSIVMYVFFSKSECGTNTAFITLNMIFCFLVSVTSIAPRVQEFNPRSGLLQSALITAYSTYLIFSAQNSESNECNPWRTTSGTGTAGNVSVILGAAFTILAICYATINAANTTSGTGEHQKLTNEVEEDGGHEEEEEEHLNPDEPVTYNFSRFHLVFALGAMYLAMLMTDWHTVYHPSSDDATVDTGTAAVWVKAVTSWLCIIIYGWTLLAPVLMPDREWH